MCKTLCVFCGTWCIYAIQCEQSCMQSMQSGHSCSASPSWKAKCQVHDCKDRLWRVSLRPTIAWRPMYAYAVEQRCDSQWIRSDTDALLLYTVVWCFTDPGHVHIFRMLNRKLCWNDDIRQRFSNWGPRTKGGPRRVPRGSARGFRKVVIVCTVFNNLRPTYFQICTHKSVTQWHYAKNWQSVQSEASTSIILTLLAFHCNLCIIDDVGLFVKSSGPKNLSILQ